MHRVRLMIAMSAIGDAFGRVGCQHRVTFVERHPIDGSSDLKAATESGKDLNLEVVE